MNEGPGAYFAWASISRIGEPNLLLPCRSGFRSAPRVRPRHFHLLEKYTKNMRFSPHKESVRINIDIDDGLMREAMRTSGAATKKAAVEAGLRLLVQTFSQSAIRKLQGEVCWDGNLNQSRLGRTRKS